MSRLTGYPVQFNKAVVGRNAFAHESGIHQHGVLRDRLTYEIMDPAEVGQSGSQIILGKHSGRAGFQDALNKIGVSLEDDAFQRAFNRVKELADRKVEINEEELRIIVADTPPGDSAVEFVGMHVAGGHDMTPEATVTLRIDGDEQSYRGTGDGMVHAAFAALRQGFGIEAGLIDYRVVPVTAGADAMAEVSVVIGVDGKTYSGRGIDTDVVTGSARAFVAALNKSIGAKAEEG